MSHGHSKTSVSRQEAQLPESSIWRRIPVIAGGIGVLALAGSFVLGFTGASEQFFFSYLTSYTYWLSIALGAMFFVLIQFVTRAGWSVTVRRIAEHMMATLPLFAVLFVPLFFGLSTIYHHWWHGAGGDPIIEHKLGYLNPTFFIIRAVIVLLVWAGLALAFYRASLRQDETGDQETTRKLQMYSAPALVLFALTLTVAAIDWLMTLNPHWFSTMWGVYYFAGSLVGIFALMAVVIVSFRSQGLLKDIVTVEHQHDMGKLLFAFLVFWSYIAFSQYFLIWYAHMPEETVFFAHRSEGSWSTVSIILAAGHFIVPMFFLMSRHIKRKNITMLAGAIWMLAIHFVDLHWVVMPTLHGDGFSFHILDLTTFVGVGGVFFAAFAWLMGRAPLVPLKDPRLGEALRFENV